MKFLDVNLGWEDLKNTAIVFAAVYFWTYAIIPAFDAAKWSPLVAYLAYHVALLGGLYYLGRKFHRVRAAFGVIAWFTAKELLDLPFCPLFTTDALPSSQTMGPDCVLKFMLMDQAGLSYDVAYALTYYWIPVALILIGGGLLLNKKLPDFFKGHK